MSIIDEVFNILEICYNYYGDIMKIDNFSILVEKYKDRIEHICNSFNYPDNISHLFYIIIPIFIIKYGIDNEKLILQMFSSVPVIVKDTNDKTHQAFYMSIPQKNDNHITTNKFIVLNLYENISLIQLLENLIHEYNHALNSYRNEISVKDNVLYLRTGLTFISYDFQTLKLLSKDNSFVLEEILNTHQTENMINLIFNIPVDYINDSNLKTSVFSIQKEMSYNYCSSAYLLQMTICKYILQNKTFTSTLNNLRIRGNIEDIEGWFNNITGINNSYYNFILYLNEILTLEQKLSKVKFKYFTIKKIKNLTYKLISIIEIFNKNCTYK